MVRIADRTISGSPAGGLSSPKQVANVTGMSIRTVYRRAADGQFPTYRSGRLIRFDLAEVLAAMREEAAA